MNLSIKKIRRYADLYGRAITPGKLANAARYYRDLRRKPVLTHSFPPLIAVQPSALCNSNCRLCPLGIRLPGPEKGMMEPSVFRKLIDQTASRLIHVFFGDWGEPFLNPGIYEMMNYARKRRVATSVSTNLHAFKSETDLEKLLREGPTSTLIVSTHGSTRDTYDAYQPGFDYGAHIEKLRTLATIKKRLGMRKPVTRLAYAITRKNQSQIPEMKALASELDAEYEMYTASINVRYFLNNPRHLKALIDEWAQNDNWHMLDNSEFSNKDKLEKFYAVLHDRHDSVKPAELEKEGLTGRSFCADPWRSLVVNWDGGISLCCVDYYKYNMGNIQEENALSIWNNEKYRDIRRYMLGDNRAAPGSPCRYCVPY